MNANYNQLYPRHHIDLKRCSLHTVSCFGAKLKPELICKYKAVKESLLMMKENVFILSILSYNYFFYSF